MRVKNTAGAWGEATLQRCQILRFDASDGTYVRNFYQQFVVRVEFPGLNTRWVHLINYGPGTEAPVGSDLRGGCQASQAHASFERAWAAVCAQCELKIKKGYRFFTEYSEQAQLRCPPKLLEAMQLEAVPDGAVEQRLGAEEVAALTAVVSQATREVAAQVAAGTLAAAVQSRHVVVDLTDQLRALLANTEGQVEALDTLITQEITA